MRSSPYSKWNWTYNQLSYPSSSARPFPDCLQVSAPRFQNIHKLQPYCKLQPSVTEHVVTSPEENDTIQKWGEGPPSIRKLGEDACMPWIAWSCAQCRTVASPAFPKTQCQHQPMSTHSYHSTTEKSPQQYNLTKWVPVITLWELAAQKVSDLPSQKIAVTKVAHWLHHKMLLTKDNCCSMQSKEVLTSPALKMKRLWSKNNNTDGAVSPVSIPVPRICHNVHFPNGSVRSHFSVWVSRTTMSKTQTQSDLEMSTASKKSFPYCSWSWRLETEAWEGGAVANNISESWLWERERERVL